MSVVGLKSLDVSPCNELLLLLMIIKKSHTPTHKSTFGVYYRIGGVASWWRGSVVERRSLAGELSLSCARPAADG